MLAAADRFAGLRKVKGLGHALRAACDGLIAKVDAEATQRQLATWRQTLGTWEQLAEEQQEIEIARGMRLIAALPRLPSAAPPRPSGPTVIASVKRPSEKPAGSSSPS